MKCNWCKIKCLSSIPAVFSLGLNLSLQGSKKIEAESFCQQLTTSSTTHLKYNNMPMQLMDIIGAYGACISLLLRIGWRKERSLLQSGEKIGYSCAQ